MNKHSHAPHFIEGKVLCENCFYPYVDADVEKYEYGMDVKYHPDPDEFREKYGDYCNCAFCGILICQSKKCPKNYTHYGEEEDK